MSNPADLALVVKAVHSGLGGCVEWDVKVTARLKPELALHELTIRMVRSEVIQHVQSGGEVFQVKETREGWKDRRDYWYKVIVPMPAIFTKGLFVELELVNSDPDFPEVSLVNAHEQQ